MICSTLQESEQSWIDAISGKSIATWLGKFLRMCVSVNQGVFDYTCSLAFAPLEDPFMLDDNVPWNADAMWFQE